MGITVIGATTNSPFAEFGPRKYLKFILTLLNKPRTDRISGPVPRIVFLTDNINDGHGSLITLFLCKLPDYERYC